MRKLADLASRPDFQLGPLSISPARRLVAGPAGEANAEPVIMQVLLLLIEARGEVVTRAALFDQVWGGTMVGDDSLNRAVARVRKLLAEAAPGAFEVETIPRTGYRLLAEADRDAAGAPAPAQARSLARRAVIGGALALAGAGGVALWLTGSRQDREFETLMARGEEALAYGDQPATAADFFQRAAALRGDSARALGLLAYARAWGGSETAGREGGGRALRDAEQAVAAALAIDPDEPNARVARIVLQRPLLDLVQTEDRLRDVLASDPDNTNAMRHLWNLLQCVGRSREALALVERALAIAPLGAANHFPRAQLLWILGKPAEASRVIDRAMDYWPSHRWVRFARFIIFAFTGRASAALAMLDGRNTAPQHYSPEAIALWRTSLAALDSRSPADVAAAISANVEQATQNPRLASQAVMVLARLGAIDSAFEVANAQLLFHSPPDTRPPGPEQRQGSTAWAFAPWLFTPPVTPLLADPRIKTLCDGIGLTEYWTRRGVGPDYRIGVA